MSRVLFQINAEALPPSDAFLYLGQKITYYNSDWMAVYQNLRKARRRWGIIARVMAKTVSTVRGQGVMYKVMSQPLLLYGSDSWVVTGGMLKFLEVFHHGVTMCIKGMMATRGAGRKWE